MELAFLLKKVISSAIMPLSITLFILFLGLLYLYNHNLKKAKLFITTGFLALFLIGYQPFTNFLFSPLETKYSKLTKIPKDITHILLLGGDVDNRGWEALRLYHSIENAKIITSGYKGIYDIPEATRTAKIFQNMGIPKEDIIIHNKPKDTKEEAIETKKLLGNKPFILVTSSYHMPRAIALFQKEGLNPIAAPTDTKINKNRFISIPTGGGINKTETALHEYLGLLWSRIKGQI